jgi:hypothetical protein
MQSHEWKDLQARWVDDMARRAIVGGFEADKVAELARDKKGHSAFTLWCQNELTRKAGQVDGRAKRYSSGAARTAGSAQGESNGAGGSSQRSID